MLWNQRSPLIMGGHLRIRLNGGTERQVDHVLQATGYRVDISKYPFSTGFFLDKSGELTVFQS